MITVEVLNIEQDPTGFRHLTANRPCEAGCWKQNNSLAKNKLIICINKPTRVT